MRSLPHSADPVEPHEQHAQHEQHEQHARHEQHGVLCRFRSEVYACLDARADALFELADAVLCAYREERNRVGSIVCTKCREENPATFELCWNCGWSL